MGLFDSFRSLVKATIDTALLPIDIVHDVLTLGGAANDSGCAIADRIKKVTESLENAYDEIND